MSKLAISGGKAEKKAASAGGKVDATRGKFINHALDADKAKQAMKKFKEGYGADDAYSRRATAEWRKTIKQAERGEKRELRLISKQTAKQEKYLGIGQQKKDAALGYFENGTSYGAMLKSQKHQSSAQAARTKASEARLTYDQKKSYQEKIAKNQAAAKKTIDFHFTREKGKER